MFIVFFLHLQGKGNIQKATSLSWSKGTSRICQYNCIPWNN